MSSSFNEIGSEMNNDSALDLFELKYLEEISFLFNVLKGMDNYFGLDLLWKHNFIFVNATCGCSRPDLLSR